MVYQGLEGKGGKSSVIVVTKTIVTHAAVQEDVEYEKKKRAWSGTG